MHSLSFLPPPSLSLWLSTVKTGVTMQGPQVDLELTVASSALWEFLYSNGANLPHITTPVSASPVRADFNYTCLFYFVAIT